MKTTYLFIVSQIISFSSAMASPDTVKTLSGKLVMDGSSTVFPISEAMGEEFQKLNPGVKVAIALSGTGGGFKKFCKGEIDLTGASRPMEPSELKVCADAKIEFVELPVAYDGISVVVNKANTWANSLTVAELKKIWEPSSTITKWSQVRAGFPDSKITLYGPGHDSGTFDYFTKVINGKEKASRSDFTASEDDNVLVGGIAGDKNALGYFGFAYFEANAKKLNLVGIDSGKGIVLPSFQTINSGKYAPLSRPLLIYVSTKSLQRTEVNAFATFYIQQAPALVSQVGYATLEKKLYPLVMNRLTKGITGTMYSHSDLKSTPSLSVLLTSKKPLTKVLTK